MPKLNSIPITLALYSPVLTKVFCVWYNKPTDRGRLKIEYYVPRQLQLSLLRLKDNDHPFRVIDSYIHRHGTFLSEPNRSLICVSVSMYVRVFFVLPSLWLHKNRKVECKWLYQNSESTQTKGGSDAAQKFLYGSQPHLWLGTEAEGLHRVLLSAPAQRQQGRLLLSLAESYRKGVRYG